MNCSGDVSVCQCNHLTNFAAIMDMSNREDNDPLKSLLTYIFCGISIICLSLTVLLLLKPQRNNSNTITNRLLKTRTLIIMNLSIMLTIANILVIFGMDRTENKVILKYIYTSILKPFVLNSHYVKECQVWFPGLWIS